MTKPVHTGFLQISQFNKIAFVLFLLVVVVCSFQPEKNWMLEEVKVVKFYPNPATSFINFEFPQQIDKSYSLAIYSFVGKKMTELPVSSKKLIVPLSDYYRGIYVFQLKDRTGKIIETGKFQVEQ